MYVVCLTILLDVLLPSYINNLFWWSHDTSRQVLKPCTNDTKRNVYNITAMWLSSGITICSQVCPHIACEIQGLFFLFFCAHCADSQQSVSKQQSLLAGPYFSQIAKSFFKETHQAFSWKQHSLAITCQTQRAGCIKYSTPIGISIIRIIPHPVNPEWPFLFVWKERHNCSLFLGCVQFYSLYGKWQKHKSAKRHAANSEHVISLIPGETVVSVLISGLH